MRKPYPRCRVPARVPGTSNPNSQLFFSSRPSTLNPRRSTRSIRLTAYPSSGLVIDINDSSPDILVGRSEVGGSELRFSSSNYLWRQSYYWVLIIFEFDHVFFDLLICNSFTSPEIDQNCWPGHRVHGDQNASNYDFPENQEYPCLICE